MNTKLNLATAAALAALATSHSEASTTLAQWTFETSVPLTGGPHTAELGINASTSVASSNTGGTFSNPVGNGSAESFSSNGWNVGEYFQFTTGSVGYDNIQVSFSQQGSNTGPRDFKLQYSTDGTSYTDFASYTVLLAVPSWSSSSVNTSTQYSFDLSGVTALDNDASIFFRLTNTSTTSVNASTVAAAGSSRVDSFTVTSIPEPGAASVLGLVGILGLLRRRR